MSRPAAPPHDAAPQRFGKYQVIRHLASGGMADVYLARTRGIQGFEKTVVIKRLKPKLAENAWGTALFLQEARIAATLEHPQIAQVYDVGEESGSFFFAMEYVYGMDLGSILRAAKRQRRFLRFEDALRIVTELCGALHYAHEKRDRKNQPLGLVHRDVSPSNVLISHDGAVKLCDFGIAEVTARSAAAHRVQAGKRSYMSPEQCRGEALDRRSDIFLLGVMLHELTTLRKLFRGKSDREAMDQIVAGRARRPSDVRTDYPPALERIVMKALSVEPGKRYATALEMRQDLEAFARERKMALTAAGLSDLMADLFPLGLSEETDIDEPSDFDEVELIEVARPPRPWHRVGLVGAALGAVLTWLAFKPAVAARNEQTEQAVALQQASGDIAARIGEELRATRAKASGIAATPMLRAAIATDASTLRDMAAHETILDPAPGEVFTVAQVRGEEAEVLLQLPPEAEIQSPVRAGESRVTVRNGQLMLSIGVPIEPLYGERDVTGTLTIGRAVGAKELRDTMPDGLSPAVLRGPGGSLALGDGDAAATRWPFRTEVPIRVDPSWNVTGLTLASSGPAPRTASDNRWRRKSRLAAPALVFLSLGFFFVGSRRHRAWRRSRNRH